MTSNRRQLVALLALALTLALAGCARSTPPPQSAADPDVSAPSAQDRSTVPPTGQPVSPEPASKDKGENDVTPTISAARTAEGHLGIKRSELDKLLKRGANNFIGLIDVRPAFRRGRFFGWRVLGYRGPGALQRGDVVLRINGQSVERPGQFIGVWQRLATAKVLVVEILRRGKRKRWAFAILDS